MSLQKLPLPPGLPRVQLVTCKLIFLCLRFPRLLLRRLLVGFRDIASAKGLRTIRFLKLELPQALLRRNASAELPRPSVCTGQPGFRTRVSGVIVIGDYKSILYRKKQLLNN